MKKSKKDLSVKKQHHMEEVMKKGKKRLIWIGVVLTALFWIFTVLTGHYVVDVTKQMSVASGDSQIPYNVFEVYHLDYEKFLEDYEVKRIAVTSTYEGHEIPADYICSKDLNKSAQDEEAGKEQMPESIMNHDTVIMVHGLGGTRKSVFPVAQVFLEHGYNVLIYDQRSSGENTAKYTTFGYKEKYDLIDCANYVKGFAPDKKLGIWGTSFGGITTLMAVCDPSLGLTKNTDFMILDCPVGSMEGEIVDTLKQDGFEWISGYVSWAGNIMNQLEMGYSFKDADACYVIKHKKNVSDTDNKDVPLFVINSKIDQVTPYFMGVDIYDCYESEHKKILSFEDVKHAAGWADHEDEYRKNVEEFLAEIHMLPDETQLMKTIN